MGRDCLSGVGAAVLVSRSGGVGQSRVLGSRSPGAAAACAGLSGGGCQNAGVFLQIGSDEFFDHKGSIAADMMCPTPYDQ